MTLRSVSLCLIAGMSVIAGLGGCSSGGSSARSIRGNITPELKTYTMRPADVRNMKAHTKNANWRLLRDDAYRAILYERPSRLSLTPMPH
ncbi:hypothetical protein PHYC_00774 [Phycisphaerales bacterium]|nr:hypothetical protein PHYC_00774 [Phycisphaerales bacterium]